MDACDVAFYAFVLLQFLSCDDAIVFRRSTLVVYGGVYFDIPLFLGVVASIRGFDSRTDSKKIDESHTRPTSALAVL